MSCELCVLQRKTTWFYTDPEDRFVIIECDTCKEPMAVWLEHTMMVSEREQLELIVMLRAIAVNFYGGDDGWRIDTDQRKIPDHFHFHARRI